MRKALLVSVVVVIVLGVGAAIWTANRGQPGSDSPPQGAAEATAPDAIADGGREPEERIPEDPFARQVYNALDDARARVLESPLQFYEAWVLGRIGEAQHSRRTKQAWEEAIDSRISSSTLGRLVDPDAERPQVADDLQENVFPRMTEAARASLGEPKSKALDQLREYTGEEATGYLLSHQVLVLEWWRDGGRDLPEDLQARKKDLLQKVREEQRKAEGFSPLFAARAAVLLLVGGDRCPSDFERWARTIFEAQKEDGSWPSGTAQIAYGGKTVELELPPAQVAGHILAVLRRYLDCHFDRGGR